MSSWTHQRAVVAGLSKARPPTDPEVIAAKERLRNARRAEVTEQYVSELLARAPALTAEQRERLRPLLAESRTAGAEAGAA